MTGAVRGGAALAAAAAGLAGARFRLHGRDPATGLDCIGLLAAALAAIGRAAALPTGYTLRGAEPADLPRIAAACGFGECAAPPLPGDVVLAVAGPGQMHLAILGPVGGFVHAHAGLGRVVVTPGPLPWPIRRRWRLL